MLEVDLTVGMARERLPRAAVGLVTVGPGDPAALASAATLDHLPEDASLTDVLSDLAPVVVVPGELNVAQALTQPALRSVDPDAPGVLVTRAGEVCGLWSGASLASALVTFSGSRSLDAELPGKITHVPVIVRNCAFDGGVDLCLDRREFAERPDTMPPCANPRRLTPHGFVW